MSGEIKKYKVLREGEEITNRDGSDVWFEWDEDNVFDEILDLFDIDVLDEEEYKEMLKREEEEDGLESTAGS